MDKQTFEALKRVADRLKKLEDGEKEFLLKDWQKLFKEFQEFKVEGNDLLFNGKKIYEFYVPKDGKDGKDGKPGRDGERGLDGKAGRDGTDGKPGRDGKDGRDGKSGADGKQIELFIKDDVICWKYEGENEYYELVPLKDLKGEKGEKGERGKSSVVNVQKEIEKLFPVMTQAEYNALEKKDPNVYYCIIEG